jgi:hypothetical protein
MTGQRNEIRSKAILRALKLITEAMELIDAHDGPPEVAAQLAFAQQRLRQSIA